ncbi:MULTISPECIES: hypothetical protein [unclassified Pseudoalteromonas]|uniref:hypothetical protein n=1 Tax=unclassified Pseudoalteromonas TaxID=194690 RepID=UPI0005AAA931|nr:MULTISPECIES: hypothetical protein [unclassified Pseudoalteromonas]
MNLTIANKLKNIMQLNSLEVEIHPSYSARFNYGEKTVGLIGQFTANCIWKIIIDNRDEIEQIMPLEKIDIHSDTFGLDTIVY